MGAMNFSAQGSITVRRLRTGDVINLSMNTNGIALWQGYDPTGLGSVSPNWNTAANQPTRTPVLRSAKGKTVTMDDAKWYYNDSLISWGSTTYEADSKTYYVSSNHNGAFAWIPSTGEIRIIKNLASATNTWNDELRFECKAICDNVAYDMSQVLTVEIVKGGSSSYYATLVADSQMLTLDSPSTTLRAELHLGSSDVQEFWIKVLNNESGFIGSAVKATSHSPFYQATKSISRSDISGIAMLTAYFYLEDPGQNANAQPVAKASVKLTDVGDEFDVQLRITSSNTEVSDGNPVTVQAYVVKMSDNSEYSLTGKSPTWSLKVMNVQTWTAIATSSTDTIQVTTSHTDRNGEMYDVEVTADVSWSE